MKAPNSTDVSLCAFHCVQFKIKTQNQPHNGTICEKTQQLVIPFTVNVHGEPRHAACRGIPLLLYIHTERDSSLRSEGQQRASVRELFCLYYCTPDEARE